MKKLTTLLIIFSSLFFISNRVKAEDVILADTIELNTIPLSIDSVLYWGIPLNYDIIWLKTYLFEKCFETFRDHNKKNVEMISFVKSGEHINKLIINIKPITKKGKYPKVDVDIIENYDPTQNQPPLNLLSMTIKDKKLDLSSDKELNKRDKTDLLRYIINIIIDDWG